MTLALVILETLLLAALAWGGVKLFKGRSPGAEVPPGRKGAGTALLAAAMLAAFVSPFLQRFPYALWWIAPCAVAGVVLDGTRRRRVIRRGPLWFAAWMLLTAGLVEMVFWLGEQLVRSE